MKSIIHRFTTAAIALLAVAASVPEARATLLSIDGSGSFKFTSKESYFSGGRAQTGRYRNLGAGYYHSAQYTVNRITNSSSYKSASMSFELWSMAYLGATSGPILMTYGLGPLKGGYHYSTPTAYGKAVSLNKYRFPEFDLFEYRDSKWRYRDTLVFTTKSLL